jgi:hypothetical protein
LERRKKERFAAREKQKIYGFRAATDKSAFNFILTLPYLLAASAFRNGGK